MLDNEPDNTPDPTAAEPSARPPRRRRAASRPAGPPSSAPDAPPIAHVSSDAPTTPTEPTPTESTPVTADVAPVIASLPAPDAPAPDAMSETSDQAAVPAQDALDGAAAVAPAKKAAAKRPARKTAAKKVAEAGPDGEPVKRPARKRTTKKAAAAEQPADVAEALEALASAVAAPSNEPPLPVDAELPVPALDEIIFAEPLTTEALVAEVEVAPEADLPLDEPVAVVEQSSEDDGDAEALAEELAAAAESAEPPVDEDSTDDTDESDDDDESEDASANEGEPRRRRRRRGGRRRRRGGDNDDTDGSDDAADGEAGPVAQSDETTETDSDTTDAETTESGEADSTDADSGEDDTDSGPDGDGDGSRRRRRRRRRRGEDAGAAADDPAVTEVVVRVREPRTRTPKTNNEVTGIDGSTRMEAKRQRRREGREAGRRRAPIMSEAEFLARRESVERKMIIRQRDDLSQIAVIEDDILVEHYVDRDSAASLIGNVYLGRVQNVLPSMEAAFIDIGRGRNAVIYAGEIDWDSFGAEGQGRKVEKVLKSGQTILVQVTKDPVGAKGARLTNHVSIPGRYIVYAPGGHLSGISRKLPDNERKRLKDILADLVGESASVIVRTAAEGASEEELVRDVNRLKAQWEAIEKKVTAGQAPQQLYSEPDLTVRIVRDLFTEDFSELIIQGNGGMTDAYASVEGYVTHVAPHLGDRLRGWDAETQGDLFGAFRLDEQIAKGLERKVFLPSGGSLVIDRTEAMTVIDVNTGKFTGAGGNLEATVTSNNLEAAEEIVRQLRLRDIGGIIVIDFIDMVLPNNRELLLRRLVECLGRDRTRHQVAEVTSLGLVQMTRKKIGTGLLEAFSAPCEHCHGRGYAVHDMPVETQKQADGGTRDGSRSQPNNRRGGNNGGNNNGGGNNGGGQQTNGGGQHNNGGNSQTGSANGAAGANGGGHQGGSGDNSDGASTGGRSGRSRRGGGRGNNADGPTPQEPRGRRRSAPVESETFDTDTLTQEPSPFDAPDGEIRRDQTPIDQAPIDQAPIDQAPVDQAPVEEAPVEETLNDPSPIDQGWVEEAAEEPIPVEPVVVNESPAEQYDPEADSDEHGFDHRGHGESAAVEPAETEPVEIGAESGEQQHGERAEGDTVPS